ncbi:hypothetical protein IFM89_023408 [Coptis chinensis]|uniref:F-box protein n=1 Tax=Coptis chinensis TaxID=261450 RepID=A0A835HXG7_9MAGN|nr:hypothetical protein IFM89_023408 [Coptis chinensis]
MDMLVMHVFSPTTEKWTKHYLTVEPCINGSLWSVRYHFFDGSLYTLSICGHLLKFDLQLSCCRAIELPHVVVEAASIGCLGVSQGSLHYSWSDGQSSMTMRVWMLKVDEWVLKRTICLQYFYKHPLCSNFSSASCFSVFGFHPTSDILFVGNFGGIFCYDPCLNRLESICRSAQDKPMYRIPDFVFLFSVNLIPLEMSKWILGE